MAPPTHPRLRLYTHILHDPKIRRLTPTQRWLWIALMACARQSHQPGTLLVSPNMPMNTADIANQANLPTREVARALPVLEQLGLIAREPGERGAWRIAKWSDRQYESDHRGSKASTKPPPNDNDTTSIGRPIDGQTGDDRAS